MDFCDDDKKAETGYEPCLGGYLLIFLTAALSGNNCSHKVPITPNLPTNYQSSLREEISPLYPRLRKAETVILAC